MRATRESRRRHGEHVKLDKPIPVYLMYQTAWAADDGTVLFVEDLYGHDSTQLGLLDGGSVKPPPGAPAV